MPAAAKKPPISQAAKILGERLRQARANLKMTQEGLAEHSGLHWSYIGQVERGQNNPTLHNILLLAQVLKVDPGHLMEALPAPTADELDAHRSELEARAQRRSG